MSFSKLIKSLYANELQKTVKKEKHSYHFLHQVSWGWSHYCNFHTVASTQISTVYRIPHLNIMHLKEERTLYAGFLDDLAVSGHADHFGSKSKGCRISIFSQNTNNMERNWIYDALSMNIILISFSPRIIHTIYLDFCTKLRCEQTLCFPSNISLLLCWLLLYLAAEPHDMHCLKSFPAPLYFLQFRCIVLSWPQFQRHSWNTRYKVISVIKRKCLK